MKKLFFSLTVIVLSLSLFGGWFTPSAKITTEGGYAISMVNATGTTSVKGQVVSVGVLPYTNIVTNTTWYSVTNIVTNITTNIGSYFGFIPTSIANLFNSIGVVYDTGIANGQSAYIVIGGICDALIETNSVATNGWYMYASTNFAGRLIGNTLRTNTINVVGFCLVTTNGLTNTDTLCRIVLRRY